MSVTVHRASASTADAALPVTSQPIISSLTDFPACLELKESVDVLLPYNDQRVSS